MPGLSEVPIPGVKTYHLALFVRYSPQENWTYAFDFDDEGTANSCRSAVQSCLPEGQVLVLLKTRERVSFGEVADVLAKRQRPSSTEDARKVIESHIMSGNVDGVVDSEGYVSRLALQSGLPQREVIKSETITREVVKVQCKYCGAMNNLATDKFCAGCGAPVRLS